MEIKRRVDAAQRNRSERRRRVLLWAGMRGKGRKAKYDISIGRGLAVPRVCAVARI